MDLSGFRAKFQPALEGFLHEKCAANAALADDAFIANIIQYPETLAGGEGKRVRPYMAWLMYRAMGGEDTVPIMKMLASLEFFHVFALVHDDVMDRGATRHGIPTAHRMVEEALKKEKRIGDLAHVGEAHAILLGDLLFQWSQEAFFSTAGIDALARDRATSYFRTMIEEVIVGQMMDIDLTTREHATDAFVERKTHLKTSSYTFVRPLQIGAALAGASNDAMMWCEQFGTVLGRAFQMQDDLLDLTISSTEMGKTAFSDLREGQHSMLMQYVFSHGTDAQKQELRSFYGADLTEADRPRVTALFESSGAFAYGNAEIERSFAESERLLATAPMSDEWRAFFAGFIQKLKGRAS